MKTLIKYPQYQVLYRGHRRFKQTFDMLRSPPNECTGLTVIWTPLPPDVVLDCRHFILVRYCLDRIMTTGRQVCLTLGLAAANADVFFDETRMSGLEQTHAMAHLLLSCLASGLIAVPFGQQIDDRFFKDPENPKLVAVVLTVPLRPEDGLHDLIIELWESFQALLAGSIEGLVAELLFHAP